MKNIVWGGGMVFLAISVRPLHAQERDPFLLPASTITCHLAADGTYTCVSHAKPLTLTNVTASVGEARRIHEVLILSGQEAPRPHIHESKAVKRGLATQKIHPVKTAKRAHVHSTKK